MNVAIIVTHLLGTGHLRRAMTLAKAFAAAGHAATVISGGTLVAALDTTDVTLIHLPPLRSDGTNFRDLLDGHGQVASKQYLADRQAALIQALDRAKPDALITELFPFGRRSLEAEFLAALAHVAAWSTPPKIFASIRDILAPPSKPSKAEATQDRLQHYYDGVLVHASEQVTPLHASWPVTPQIEALLHYTGYVAPPAAGPHPQATGTGEVLVSAGGGSVGETLFRAAAKASELDPSRTWRLLIGGGNTELQQSFSENHSHSTTVIEHTRPDFRQMLYHAACSVSLCGYNTALDLMQARCKGLFIPFDEGGETEQTLRAQSLAEQPSFDMIRATDVTPETLLDAVNALTNTPVKAAPETAFDGAAKTVEIIETALT